MPNISVSFPHQLDRNEAKKRAAECVSQFRQQYGSTLGQLEERWEGDTMHFTFTAMGTPISGQALIEDRSVRLEVEVPWILSMLAGSIKQSIEQQGRKLLGAR